MFSSCITTIPAAAGPLLEPVAKYGWLGQKQRCNRALEPLNLGGHPNPLSRTHFYGLYAKLIWVETQTLPPASISGLYVKLCMEQAFGSSIVRCNHLLALNASLDTIVFWICMYAYLFFIWEKYVCLPCNLIKTMCFPVALQQFQQDLYLSQ